MISSSIHNRIRSREDTYEELILGTLDRILCVEERETDEQARHDVERQLRNDIRRITPVGLRISLKQRGDLVRPRCRKLALKRGLYCWALTAFGMNLLNLRLEVRSLG